MRIVFDGVDRDDKQSLWKISYHEEGEGAEENKIVLLAPFSMMDWRAAEYNIPPTDIDTLIDIMMLEQYISVDFFNGPNSLFNAPSIEIARTAYLAEIVRLKLLYRVSTRTKNHPLAAVRDSHTPSDPLDMAHKGMTVLFNRQFTGAEQLDPAVATVLSNFRDALQIQQGKV